MLPRVALLPRKGETGRERHGVCERDMSMGQMQRQRDSNRDSRETATERHRQRDSDRDSNTYLTAKLEAVTGEFVPGRVLSTTCFGRAPTRRWLDVPDVFVPTNLRPRRPRERRMEAVFMIRLRAARSGVLREKLWK